MKKKNVIIYLIVLLISMCLSSGARAETHENKESYYIKEVVMFDEVKTDNDMDIKLFGITDEHFNRFKEEYQQSNYDSYRNNKNIKRFITTVEEDFDLTIKLNYINKNIEDDHSNNLNKIFELIKDTPVNMEFLPNNEAIIWCNEININEYILEHGFAAVDEKDKQVNSELIKKYSELQQSAEDSEYGIWGTIFSITNIESVSIEDSPNAPLYIHIIVFFAILFMAFMSFKFRNNAEHKIDLLDYLWSIIFWMMGIFITLGLIICFPYDKRIYWVFVSILILGLVYYCIKIIRNIKKVNIVYLLINSFGIVISVIILFAIIYFEVSFYEIKVKDYYFNYPVLQLAQHEVVDSPYENYIHIPIDNYKITQGNHFNNYLYEFSLTDALYFSCTTYFTVGYGDYYPCGSLRILSMGEMIIAFFLNLTVLGVAINKYFDSNDDNYITKRHRNRRHKHNKYKRKLKFKNY